MPLIAAVAGFRSHDDASAGGANVSVFVDGPMGRVAQLDRIGTDLDNMALHPFPLSVVRGIDRGELEDCRTRVHMGSGGFDTWTFDFEIVLSFDDAPAFNKRWSELTLDQDNCDFSDGLV